MTVPREPDHVHEKRDARTAVVAEDEAVEDGTGDVEELHPAETEDEGLEHPAEEDGEDDIGDDGIEDSSTVRVRGSGTFSFGPGTQTLCHGDELARDD